jgi:hypothetical protein
MAVNTTLADLVFERFQGATPLWPSHGSPPVMVPFASNNSSKSRAQ